MAAVNRREVERRVFANLDAAFANEFSFVGWDDDDVADDLICFAEDCEEIPACMIVAAVKKWRRLKH